MHLRTLIPYSVRFCCLALGLSLILGSSFAQSSYQIKRDTGMRIMQSGNPGVSAQFSVASAMKIQPGRLISQNYEAIVYHQSAPTRHIINVCNPDTDECVSMYPTGSDEDYTTYEDCVKVSGNEPYECAEEWAVAKGLMPEALYLAMKAEEVAAQEPEQNPLESLLSDLGETLQANLFDEAQAYEEPESPWKTAAPEAPEPEPEMDTSLVVEGEDAAVSFPTRPFVGVEDEEVVNRFEFDVTGLKSAAPAVEEVVAEETLAPREPSATEARDYFSCVRVPHFVAYNDWWKWIAYRLFIVLISLVIIIFLLAFWVYLLARKLNNDEEEIKESSKLKMIKDYFKWSLIIAFCFGPGLVQAQIETTPQLLIYEGELYDNFGNALAGNYDFRFSFWANADYENTDVVAGVINGAAPDYYNWQEVQAQILDSEGRFSFQVGTVVPFVAGMFDQDELFLQVEVKQSADPDANYEVIDVDASDFLVDRKVIASVPFAFNANKLDYRDTGFGAGEIPFLDALGELPLSAIPDITGSDSGVFSLDQDGDSAATDTLILRFGSAIAESLAWNGLLGQFEFSDDLVVGGDLTVTGTINGVPIGPQDITTVLSPRFPNSIFENDGSQNSGSMYEERESAFGGVSKQVLRWEAEEPGVQQDYDTLIRYTLPQNFSSWQATPLSLEYVAPGGVPNSHIDFRIYRDGSATDELLGTGLDRSSNSWQLQNFTLNPGYTWVAGDTLWLEVRMHSRDTFHARVADIRLNYVVE